MNRSVFSGRQQNGGIGFSVLNDGDRERIHAASMEILWKTGIFVQEDEALDLFADGGASVDSKTNIVKMPAFMVEDAIRSAPQSFILAGRNPKHDVSLEMDRVSFTPFGTAVRMTDPDTGEIRIPQKTDLADCIRLIDALDNIDTGRRAVSSYDVPQQVAAVHDAEAILLNTTKHCLTTTQNGHLAEKIIQMMAAIVGGREKLRAKPIMTFNNCMVTPLKMPRDCSEVIMAASRVGLVVQTLSQALAGGTSPVTLAGTIALHNAEVLSGLVLSQLTRRGNPFIYCSSTCSLDLRYGTAAVGNPEAALLNAGIVQMARYYCLPCRVSGG